MPERVRNLTISQPFDARFPPSVMTLNNLHFTSTDVETPRQGSVEQWNLINTTPDPHPIHLHLVMFRVLGRQPFNAAAHGARYPRPPVGTKRNPPADRFVTGPAEPADRWESGRKDTVRTDGYTITRVIVRFPRADELGFDPDAPFPGTGHHGEELRGYVWHCHLLDHEDHDMMLSYRTVAP